MAQEIEIEYKTLLTKQEYTSFLHALPFPKDAIIQTNYYFETKNFALKDHRSALRIRKHADNFTLTLKEPHHEGILETHDQLTQSEFEQWITNHPVPKENVLTQLTALDISITELIYCGSLQTERREFIKGGVTYVLDKSIYNHVTDYELEIEAPSKKQGQVALQNLLEQFPVKKQQSITKIERFFNSLP